MMDFNNINVVVSGAAIGFGREIAKRFSSAGATVFACDIQQEKLAELQAFGIHTAKVDLCDRQAAQRWIEQVGADTGGRIDVLVNNAGGVAGQSGKPIETITDEEWDRIIAINLGAAFALSRAVAPMMKKAGKGAIINISSGAALKASLTGVQAYCASKHAVLGLTRQLAHELGPFGIRVNSVAPGFVITNEATQKQWEAMGEEVQKRLLASIALRRLGTPAEIASTALYLASELASFVNGQIISVDGGQ